MTYAMVFKLKIADFVDKQTFESGVKERDSLKPADAKRHLVPVDQKASEEEAGQQKVRGNVSIPPLLPLIKGNSLLKQHNQTSY